MQIVPAIIEDVNHLTIFQRSKQWAAPFKKFKQSISNELRFLLDEVPYYHEWYRQRLTWIFNDRIHSSLQIDPTWNHPDRSVNAHNDKHREHFTSYIKEQLGDRQDLLNEVLPEYPPFSKRMLMDNGWYRTMTKPNVTLTSDPIAHVDGSDVVTRSGQRYSADVLVLATGFDAVNVLSSYDLYGKNGTRIRDKWDSEGGASAYLGMSIPRFPNFFMMTGPNTALGHGGSVVSVIEIQARYILDLLRHAILQGGNNFEIEVKPGAYDAYVQDVHSAHSNMIWSHDGTSNWYKNTNGRIVATTPFRNDQYWMMMRNVKLDDYDVLT